MPRPFVLRRVGAVDRRVAAGAFSLAAIAVLGTAALVRGPAPALRRADPRAARDLVASMRSGEHGSWEVTYSFTRTLADGRVMRAGLQEARRAAVHVVIAGASMTVERSGGSVDCNLVAGRSQCIESGGARDLAPSAVLRVAIGTGAYAVSRLPDAVVAGQRARCYLVWATGHGLLPDLGVENRTCLSADGIPLGQVVIRATRDVDERVAVAVERHVSDRAIADLIRSFDPNGHRARG